MRKMLTKFLFFVNRYTASPPVSLSVYRYSYFLKPLYAAVSAIQCGGPDNLPRRKTNDNSPIPVRYKNCSQTRTGLLLLPMFLLAIISCGKPEITEAPSFVILSICNLPGYSQGIDVSGDFAYVANGQGGLQIIDVADPESTSIVGEQPTPRSAQGVAVREGFAYVVLTSELGLYVIDVTEPSACSLVGQDPGYTEYNICAPPDTFYVYIAAHDFFIIENCSIPNLPFWEQRIPTPGNVHGIFVAHSLAYLACEQMGLYIYYAARPDSAVPLLGSIDTPSNARNVYVEGDYAYVADGRAGLIIIDVSDTEAPSITGQYDTPGYANDVFVVNDFAYIADGDAGVQVVDVTDPAQPLFYASIETSYANDVYVKDDLLYIADRDMGLIIATEEVE
ncbi:MAG: hypothetical protein JSV97_08640 [candidate division WOR-3 bacterium]|nr:MAG: hypothetical protein JSV97_08640 [candidate division WOR-3 bacterium]